MFLLNLTAAEFLTLLGGLGSLIAALYLLDRSKRKKIVSTLKFWTPSERPQENQRRKRVREPWSLVMQLASLALLLLAIAQLQWGSRARRGRDYVLLLDTSAWAAQRSGGTTLLDGEKQAAQRYLRGLAAQDRLMLVRADALAAPLTPFTLDRVQIANVLAQTAAGFSALNIEQALAFAEQAQQGSGGQPGEVVYIGPGMVSEADVPRATAPRLRVITVEREKQHVGIRAASVARDPDAESAWQASVTVRNYGPERIAARLNAGFGSSSFTPRLVPLEAGAETTLLFNFVTNSAGQFFAAIEPSNDGMADSRVALEMPRFGKLRVAVLTDRPDAFRPLFSSSSQLSVRFFPAAGNQQNPPADLIVLDHTSRAGRSDAAASRAASDWPSTIWIDPPRQDSPLPVKAVVRNATIGNWHSETPLGESLHAKDTPIPAAEVFETFDGDITVGSVAEGAVVVARPRSDRGGKMAVIGFDPLSAGARMELTTPLLFANLLRWMWPDVFRSVAFAAERVGVVSIPLDPREPTGNIRVRDQRGLSAPFVIARQAIELFAGAPAVLHVSSEGRETTLSVALPDVAAFAWKAPVDAAAGMPPALGLSPGALDLWRWLALLGGLGLLFEWAIFGRRVFRRPVRNDRAPRRPVEREERELVSR